MWLSEPPIILLLVAHGCQGLKYISRNPQILNGCCGFTIKNLWSAIAGSSNECQTACLATDQYVLLHQEHKKNSWIRLGRLWCSSHRVDPRHKHRMYIWAALLGRSISQIVPTFPLLSETGFHNKPDWFGPSSAVSYFPNEFPLFHCCFLLQWVQIWRNKIPFRHGYEVRFMTETKIYLMSIISWTRWSIYDIRNGMDSVCLNQSNWKTS